jgi:GNAT superfamily N-acetyltransferase
LTGKIVKVRPAMPTEVDDVAAFCAGRGKDAKTREIKRRRRHWLQEMAPRGLKVILAIEPRPPRFIDFGDERVSRDELTLLADGLVVGLLEYVPIEETLYPVEGKGYLFVDCLWVMRPYVGRGVGRALMDGVIRHARGNDSGIATVAWRGADPADDWPYMPAAFFSSFGFEAVDEEGDRVLMAVSYGARGKPALVAPRPLEYDGVTFLCHPSCPASLWAAETVRGIPDRVEAGKVEIVEVEGREGSRRYGALFGVCVGGRVAVNRLAFASDVEDGLKRRESDRSTDGADP